MKLQQFALKKPKATKCSDHHTISLTAHTTKAAVTILRRRTERQVEDVLGEDQFGTRDGTGLLRITSERILEIDEELCACFIDWQNAYDHVKWTK